MTTVLNAPETLGKYRITGVIGEGAGGVVYKAFDTSLQRVVALKVLRHFVRGDFDAAEAFVARFGEQAAAVARLAHPSIVNIHEVNEIDGRPYLAMEYVAGMDLAQWLGAAPLPPLNLLLQVMDQLLDALEAAHRAGVRHGDLKPSNVIITSAGAIKITDFGLARCESRGGPRVGLAPEYVSGRLIDHRVDVYAAGFIFYRMLAGRDPFADGLSWPATEALGAHVRPPSTIAEAGRPAAFDAVVARAMAHDPGQRFATAADFRQALRDASDPRASVVQSGGVTIDHESTPRLGVARPAPSGQAAASVPVLTIAIPDSVLAMPAYDPWAHAGSGSAPSAGAERAAEPPESNFVPLISNEEESFVVFDEGTQAPAMSALPAEGAERTWGGPMPPHEAAAPAPADRLARAAAAANAALSAAAEAAEAARTRLAHRALSFASPDDSQRPGGIVISGSVSRPEPSRSDFAPPLSAQDQEPVERTIHGGDIQLAHPIEGELIPAEALRRVLRVLSAHFGARAGDVLKRSAGRARTIAELHALLVDEAGPEIDRKKMAKQLKAVGKLPL